MILGVVIYGGVIVLDFLLGVIMGIVYVIFLGKGVEYGIGVVVLIGLLLM